jgi:hypothetical protein
MRCRLTAARISASLKLVAVHEGCVQLGSCTTDKYEVVKLQNGCPRLSGEKE